MPRRDREDIDVAADALGRMAEGLPATGAFTVNRWDAAKTDRLNAAQWEGAQGRPINADLADRGQTIVARCEFEAARNPLVDGVIERHATDVVGPSGPRLQVQSDSPRYNQWLEDIWSVFYEMPDIEGELSGPEMIDQWIRMLWKTGEYLYRQVDDRQAQAPLFLRLRQIHPRRMVNPIQHAGDPNIVMGVETDAMGRRVRYWIDSAPDIDFAGAVSQPEPVDARFIGHRFRSLEPGQRRGAPWLAPCLQVVADIRSGDNEILDAIRNAASWSVFLQTHGDQPEGFTEVNTIEEMERRMMRTLPAGYQAKEVKGDQPNTNYLGFRDERLRELGMPVGMPLLMVKNDAGGHNYSSARFDGLGYWRHIKKQRAWIEKRDLNRLVGIIAHEARLNNMFHGVRMSAMPKGKVAYTWHWPEPQQLDMQKEWAGIGLARALGGMTFDKMLSVQGTDRETFIAEELRARKAFDKAGLQYPEMADMLKAISVLGGDQNEGDEPAKENKKKENAVAVA